MMGLHGGVHRIITAVKYRFSGKLNHGVLPHNSVENYSTESTIRLSFVVKYSSQRSHRASKSTEICQSIGIVRLGSRHLAGWERVRVDPLKQKRELSDQVNCS